MIGCWMMFSASVGSVDGLKNSMSSPFLRWLFFVMKMTQARSPVVSVKWDSLRLMERF